MMINEVTPLDHNHPVLCLQLSDAPGTVLVPIKLTGPENYDLWIRSMKLSRKIGKIPVIVYATSAKTIWLDFTEIFDRTNLTRIYNLWTEIATLRQGTDTVTTYYSRMKDLWDEVDVSVPLPACDCSESAPYVEHLKSQRLLRIKAMPKVKRFKNPLKVANGCASSSTTPAAQTLPDVSAILLYDTIINYVIDFNCYIFQST
ncbi:hypothetical protein KY285_023827 [Solanum tuberosum]|nr:hypothetical protein KY285_023827 [Solanum tuberosum]